MVATSAYTAVLDPSIGLVSKTVLTEPRDGYPLWQLAGIRHDGDRVSVSGATGFTRGEGIVRGIGEIVERYPYELLARGLDRCELERLMLTAPPADAYTRLDSWRRGGLCPNDLGVSELEWMEASRFSNESTASVPVFARADAAQWAAPDFDPHPSGWASGLSIKAAAGRAWAETIERDAFMCAWLNFTPVYRCDTERINSWWEQAGGKPEALVGYRRHSSLSLGLVPASGGRWVSFAVGVSNGTARTSVGLGCDPEVGVAAARALREMLQVGAFVESTRVRGGDPVVEGTEEYKGRFLRTEQAAEAATAFVDGWHNLEQSALGMLSASPCGSAPASNSNRIHAEHLDPRIILDVDEAVIMDFTPLLPPSVRALGWSVVRVASPKAMQFRMNESLLRTWSITRAEQFLTDPSPELFQQIPLHPLP